MLGHVYFLQIEFNGPVKIGYATNVASRIKNIETSMPWNLELIGSIPGDPPHETLLHALFSKYNMRREWYFPEKDLLDGIDLLLSVSNPWQYIEIINKRYFIAKIPLSYQRDK